MQAIVMAAGEGTRLRPLTERWPKPVLPVDGRPVIALLLRELHAAGCDRATIVTGHLAEQVEALVGDGAGFALAVDYVHQPRRDGSADAVRRALAAGAPTPTIVAAADTVYEPGALARFRAGAEGAPGAIAVRPGQPPSGGKQGISVEAGRVVQVVVEEAAGGLTSAPLWWLSDAIVPHLAQDEPPYELSAAYQAAVDAGVEVRAVPVGGTRDLTHPVDLVRENFPYLT